MYIKVKAKAWIGPGGSRRYEASRFQDNRHMNVVRLSDLRIPRRYSWYSCLLQAASISGNSVAVSIMPMKNSIDTIGNQTRDFRLVAQCLN